MNNHRYTPPTGSAQLNGEPQMATVRSLHDRSTSLLDLEPPQFSRRRVVVAVFAMTVTVVLAGITTFTVTDDAGGTPPVTPAVTAAVTAALAVSGGRLTALARRGCTYTGVAGGVFGAAYFAVLLAAAVAVNAGYVLAFISSLLVFHLICTINLPAIAEYLSHAWWTPAGASREATALAVIDAADHAQNLLRDRRLDGASADQLVRVFVLDARAAAADAVGDARDTVDRGGRFVCSACGTDTETSPCGRHQPFLHLERERAQG